MTDILVFDHGSIIALRPLTPEAEVWLEEHVDPDASWFGSSICVEARFAGAILDGLMDDGLVCEAGQ